MKVTSSIRHIVLTAVFLLASGAVSAANSSILVELNKLEDRNGACRAYLIVENKDTTKFETLNLDLVMFDVEGIVVGRLAFDTAPLLIGKTNVRVFDIEGLSCSQIGRLLLNDVISCADSVGERLDCLSLIATRARGSVDFIK